MTTLPGIIVIFCRGSWYDEEHEKTKEYWHRVLVQLASSMSAGCIELMEEPPPGSMLYTAEGSKPFKGVYRTPEFGNEYLYNVAPYEKKQLDELADVVGPAFVQWIADCNEAKQGNMQKRLPRYVYAEGQWRNPAE